MTVTISGPAVEDVERVLRDAHAAYKDVSEGANASYIPALASVPSGLFGLAAVTVDGKTVEIGDTQHEFAIESISKVFSMALAMEEVGAETVRAKIGANPTGLPFNSVIAVELHGGKPLSPLVNAGAMSAVSLLTAASPAERWSKLLALYGRFAGRQLRMMEDVYASEAASNFHNRGIAWLLYSYGTMYCDPMEACDVYTRQCSVAVTARDLAVMGATLAAGGVNPLTGQRAVAAANVPRILAEMAMEGLYGASGDWAFATGLPGKSGVGGGLLAVAPGKLAIAAFAPPLDPEGNSVKGVRAVARAANALGLNVFAG